MFAIKIKEGAEMVKIPVPENPEDENVVVKVKYSGICGSDIHLIKKQFPAKDEIIPGHEFTGVVTSIGSKVTKVKVGDSVICLTSTSFCRGCEPCILGTPIFCKTGGLLSTVGFFKDGGWAEFCELEECQVTVLPSTIGLDIGVLIEPLGCIINAFNRMGAVHQNSKVLIMGAGIIGLLWSCFLHFKGYKNVTITEPIERKREMVNKLNLDYKVMCPNEMKGQLKNMKEDNLGFNVIVDCSGNAKAIESCLQWLLPGGKLNLFGVCDEKEEIKMSPGMLAQKEICIFTTLGNTTGYGEAIPVAADMGSKYLQFKNLGVEVFPFMDYKKALADFQEGLVTKAVFKLE